MRKIEKPKPVDEAAAGEKPPVGAGAGEEGVDGGVGAVRWASNAILAIVAPAIAWRAVTPAALQDAADRGDRADVVAAALAPPAASCALVPGIAAWGGGGDDNASGIEAAGAEVAVNPRVDAADRGVEPARGAPLRGGMIGVFAGTRPIVVVEAVPPTPSTVCVVVAMVVWVVVARTWPTGLSAAPVVFSSVVVAGLVSSAAAEVVTCGAALTTPATGALED